MSQELNIMGLHIQLIFINMNVLKICANQLDYGALVSVIYT